MSWAVIAKKDFRDASRSKALWALTVIFVLFMAGAAYLTTILLSAADEGTVLSSLDYVLFLLSSASFLIPIIGLVITHKSLSGEVETGKAKLLLSLPHTRRDAVIGKVLGRAAVLGVSILVGLLVAVAVVLALYDTFDVSVYVIFAVFTLLLGLVYTAIGVGISAVTKRSGRATILAAAFFIIFEFAWGFIRAGIYYLLNGRFSPPLVVQGPNAPYIDAPSWYFFFIRLSPSSAYSTAVEYFTGGTTAFLPAFDPVPFYLSGWASLIILIAWLVIVPFIGYSVFKRADL